jgi:UDP-N-acetylmuramoyl-tripeptide--D-alanyl-D-alanine ligase
VLRSADGTRVTLSVHGEVLAADVEVPTGVQPANLACAVAVALVLGVVPGDLAARLVGLPSVDHRLQAARAPSGVMILDDTYNANPAGAAEALGALGATAQAAGTGRRVVVTPGMVELGRRQYQENQRFGEKIAEAADHLVVVGRTNRRALLAGVRLAPAGSVEVTTARHRDEAVAWVRAHLTGGDAVLYENDLPDHYP